MGLPSNLLEALARVARPPEGHGCHGSTTSIPVCSKSLALRVASPASWVRQMEAICASKPPIGRPRIPGVDDRRVVHGGCSVEGRHLVAERVEHVLCRGAQKFLASPARKPLDAVEDLGERDRHGEQLATGSGPEPSPSPRQTAAASSARRRRWCRRRSCRQICRSHPRGARRQVEFDAANATEAVQEGDEQAV